jgi:hypothetical protein
MSVNKYQIFCITEGTWVSSYGTEEPHHCANDQTHIINDDSIQLLETISNTTVIISEESIPTGGHFKSRTIECNIPAGVTGIETDYDHIFPYDVSMLNVFFNTDDIHNGDTVSAHVSPLTLIGMITEDYDMGVTTTMHVSPSTIEHIFIGCYIDLYSGITGGNVGCVTQVDKLTNTITMCEISDLSEMAEMVEMSEFPTGSYVHLTVKMIDKFHLEANRRIILGGNKIGSSFVPANTIGRIKYTNNSGDAKRFIFGIEYLY